MMGPLIEKHLSHPVILTDIFDAVLRHLYLWDLLWTNDTPWKDVLTLLVYNNFFKVFIQINLLPFSL